MPLPPVTAVEIDGIPAYVADVRTVFTGTLTFGVGLRDETARSGGTAHLIEHLIMHRVGRISVAHNASTSDETITFFAQGAPAAVADFLTRVGRAVSTLGQTTDAEVAEQRWVISSELGDDDERPGRGHLIDRFGNQSLGLLDLGTPAHRSVTRDEALNFAATWLHTGNAALSFTGPVPDGFTIELPAARPLSDYRTPELIRSGEWVVNGDIPVALSLPLSMSDRPAAALARTLIADALHDALRTERTLIYSVQPMVLPMSEATHLTAYALDPRPEAALETAAAALGVLRALATDGPTEAALSEQLERWAHAEEDPATQADYVADFSISMLRGRRRRGDVTPLEGLESVTADRVRSAIAAGVADVFVTFRDELVGQNADKISDTLALTPAGDPEAHLTRLSKWEMMRHLMADETESFSGRLFKGALGAELIIDTERVSLTADGVFEVRFVDVVLATYSPKLRLWTLVARQGHVLFVDLDMWRSSKKISPLLSARIPSEVQCEVDASA